MAATEWEHILWGDPLVPGGLRLSRLNRTLFDGAAGVDKGVVKRGRPSEAAEDEWV